MIVGFNEIKTKFQPKKLAGEPLILSYFRLGMDKRAEKVDSCGSFLEFVKTSDDFKLHRANFCRDRLCPMCSWRRSYKIFGQVSQIMDLIAGKYDFLFLTLTVRNCSSEDLVKTLDRMNKAFDHLRRYKQIKAIMRGFFKALEITYNKEADTYHPHIHCVLAVPKSYFKSVSYLSHDDFLNLWRKAYKDSTITQVDIRKARDKSGVEGRSAAQALSSAVAEIAKYAVKSSDYLFDDEEMTDKVVGTLAAALHHKRLCSFGGCFADAHKRLGLDDAEDGDLIHLDGSVRTDVAYQIYRFGWSCGVYKLLGVEDVVPDPDDSLVVYDADD